MIKVPVTNYVHKFLLYEFGPGPYSLTQTTISKLRFEFMAVQIYAANYTSLYTQQIIHLDIASSPSLVRQYEENKRYFERGIFGAGAFFYAFEHQVNIMHDMMKLSYEDAIEKFKEKYMITEEDYSFDNMWRQYCRIQRRNRSYQGNRRWQRPNPAFTIRLKPSKHFFITSNK